MSFHAFSALSDRGITAYQHGNLRVLVEQNRSLYNRLKKTIYAPRVAHI